MMCLLHTTEDPRIVNTDKLSKGMDEYFDVGYKSVVFEFMCTYVLRPSVGFLPALAVPTASGPLC